MIHGTINIKLQQLDVPTFALCDIARYCRLELRLIIKSTYFTFTPMVFHGNYFGKTCVNNEILVCSRLYLIAPYRDVWSLACFIFAVVHRWLSCGCYPFYAFRNNSWYQFRKTQLNNRDGLNVVVNEESLSLLRIEVQCLVHSPVVIISYFIKSNQLINCTMTYTAYVLPR